MSNIAVIDQHSEYIEKHLDLIQNQNKLSKSDLENFALQCKRTGLDPITRQIYAIPSGGKLNIMASIDGLRLIAERSGAYEGQTAPQWCGSDGVWKDVWLSNETPKACKIGVYKTKFREALYGVALFDEYAGKQNGKLSFMWAKMPALMIAKVAEALALRKAFPNEMSGIYSTEEMDQASIEKPEQSVPQRNVAAPKETPKQQRAVSPAEDVEEYTIDLGPKNKMTGTKLDEHQDSWIRTSIEKTINWHTDNKKDMHPNTKEFVLQAEQYLAKKNGAKNAGESIPY